MTPVWPAGGRALLARLHRTAGLALAFFLIVAGATGALIAFTTEIDSWLNPDLRRAEWSEPVVSPFAVVERIEAADPRGRVTFAQLRYEPGRAALFFVKPRRPGDGPLAYNQVYVDPGDGTVLGRRRWGAFSVDRRHLVPWIYEIHYSLFLPEALSGWFLGLLAAAWAVDCVVGLLLTLPQRRPFWRGWSRAWILKRQASSHRRTVDLHRAGGLWCWGLLLLMALTGFYLRVGDDTVRPLLAALSSITPTPIELREAEAADAPPELRLDMAAAVARAAALAAARGWGAATAISLDPETAIYVVSFLPGTDRGIAAPSVFVDGANGALLGSRRPFSGTFADRVLDLPRPLHGGKIAGLPGRIAVAAAGLVTVVLALTGIAIWWRKRRRP